MKCVITYFAGAISALLIMTGLVFGNLVFNIISAALITVASFICAYRIHKIKRKEYYDRFKTKDYL